MVIASFDSERHWPISVSKNLLRRLSLKWGKKLEITVVNKGCSRWGG